MFVRAIRIWLDGNATNNRAADFTVYGVSPMGDAKRVKSIELIGPDLIEDRYTDNQKSTGTIVGIDNGLTDVKLVTTVKNALGAVTGTEETVGTYTSKVDSTRDTTNNTDVVGETKEHDSPARYPIAVIIITYLDGKTQYIPSAHFPWFAFDVIAGNGGGSTPPVPPGTNSLTEVFHDNTLTGKGTQAEPLRVSSPGGPSIDAYTKTESDAKYQTIVKAVADVAALKLLIDTVTNDLALHAGDNIKHVTQADRDTWDAKMSKVAGATVGNFAMFGNAGQVEDSYKTWKDVEDAIAAATKSLFNTDPTWEVDTKVDLDAYAAAAFDTVNGRAINNFDVYLVKDENKNYYFDNGAWVEFSVDLSNYYNKQEIDASLTGITSAASALKQQSDTHIADNLRHVTQLEKDAWNAKVDQAALTAEATTRANDDDALDQRVTALETAPGGAAAWGQISGNIAAQTDLQTALKDIRDNAVLKAPVLPSTYNISSQADIDAIPKYITAGQTLTFILAADTINQMVINGFIGDGEIIVNCNNKQASLSFRNCMVRVRVTGNASKLSITRIMYCPYILFDAQFTNYKMESDLNVVYSNLWIATAVNVVAATGAYISIDYDSKLYLDSDVIAPEIRVQHDSHVVIANGVNAGVRFDFNLQDSSYVIDRRPSPNKVVDTYAKPVSVVNNTPLYPTRYPYVGRIDGAAGLLFNLTVDDQNASAPSVTITVTNQTVVIKCNTTFTSGFYSVNENGSNNLTTGSATVFMPSADKLTIYGEFYTESTNDNIAFILEIMALALKQRLSYRFQRLS